MPMILLVVLGSINQSKSMPMITLAVVESINQSNSCKGLAGLSGFMWRSMLVYVDLHRSMWVYAEVYTGLCGSTWIYVGLHESLHRSMGVYAEIYMGSAEV